MLLDEVNSLKTQPVDCNSSQEDNIINPNYCVVREAQTLSTVMESSNGVVNVMLQPSWKCTLISRNAPYYS